MLLPSVAGNLYNSAFLIRRRQFENTCCYAICRRQNDNLFNNYNFDVGCSFKSHHENTVWCSLRRGLSCFSSPSIDPKQKTAFHNALPEFIESMTNHPNVNDIPDLRNWIKKILDYNLSGGKGMRGLSVVMAYEMLDRPERITENSMSKAYTLGWCCEMSYLVILDDIMDSSTTRRGQPCWYRVPEVGMASAINDANLLYNCMFYALKYHFGKRPDYVEMLNLINETMLYTSFGQFLDTKTSTKTKDYSRFSTDRHKTIVTYKTAYYTYDMPSYLGALLAQFNVDGNTRLLMRDIAVDIGVLFQIQDDYLDCYGDESITGKAGTDIQEGKCSWLAVNALQRCNINQRKVFHSCYGSDEFAHIDRIKHLYDQLKLPQLYRQVEKAYYNDIFNKIQKLPSYELRALFHRYLGITYGRKK